MVRSGEWISEGWALVRPHLGTHVLIALVVSLLSVLTVGILFGPLACGWYLIVLRQQSDSSYTPQFGDLWKGFEVFGQALLAFIVMAVASLIAGSLIGVIASVVASVPLVGQALAPLVGAAVSICLMIVFLYVFPLIVDRRMDFWAAIQTSAETTAPHFGQLIGFGLLLYLLNALGGVLCGVGALFTTPVMVAAISISYRDMIGARGDPRGRVEQPGGTRADAEGETDAP